MSIYYISTDSGLLYCKSSSTGKLNLACPSSEWVPVEFPSEQAADNRIRDSLLLGAYRLKSGLLILPKTP